MAALLKLPLEDERPIAPEAESRPLPDANQLALFQGPRLGPLPEDAVPHLIIQLQDDLSRSRRREALWLSIITHLVLALAILFGPKLPYFQGHEVRIVAPNVESRDLTFLELPPDLQKALPRPPKTNVISDKNRIATSRTPSVNQDELHKILDARKPGAPARPQPSAPAPPAQQPAVQAQAPAAQPAPQQTARNNPEANAPVLQDIKPQPGGGAAPATPNPFNL